MAKSKNPEPQEPRGMVQKLLDRMALTGRLMMDRRVDLAYKFIPPLALLYVISPIDFMPDILLPFGVVDDIGMAILGLEVFIRMAPPDVVREHVNMLKGRFTNMNTNDDIFDRYDQPGEKRKNDQRDNIIEGDYTVD